MRGVVRRGERFAGRRRAGRRDTIVIARKDSTIFGTLHSRFHKRPSPDAPAADYVDDPRANAIADVARRLVELRNCWLNPPGLGGANRRADPGYPRKPVPRDKAAAKALEAHTLAKL